MNHTTIESAYAYAVSIHSQLTVDYYKLITSGYLTRYIKQIKEEADFLLTYSLLLNQSSLTTAQYAPIVFRLEELQKLVTAESLKAERKT